MKAFEKAGSIIQRKTMQIASGPLNAVAGRNARGSANVSNRLGKIEALDKKEEGLDEIRRAALSGEYSCEISISPLDRQKLVKTLIQKKYIVVGMSITPSESGINQLMVFWYGQSSAGKLSTAKGKTNQLKECAQYIINNVRNHQVNNKFKSVYFYNPKYSKANEIIGSGSEEEQDLIKKLTRIIQALP